MIGGGAGRGRRGRLGRRVGAHGRLRYRCGPTTIRSARARPRPRLLPPSVGAARGEAGPSWAAATGPGPTHRTAAWAASRHACVQNPMPHSTQATRAGNTRTPAANRAGAEHGRRRSHAPTLRSETWRRWPPAPNWHPCLNQTRAGAPGAHRAPRRGRVGGWTLEVLAPGAARVDGTRS